jgi:hypothetical protein
MAVSASGDATPAVKIEPTTVGAHAIQAESTASHADNSCAARIATDASCSIYLASKAMPSHVRGNDAKVSVKDSSLEADSDNEEDIKLAEAQQRMHAGDPDEELDRQTSQWTDELCPSSPQPLEHEQPTDEVDEGAQYSFDNANEEETISNSVPVLKAIVELRDQSLPPPASWTPPPPVTAIGSLSPRSPQRVPVQVGTTRSTSISPVSDGAESGLAVRPAALEKSHANSTHESEPTARSTTSQLLSKIAELTRQQDLLLAESPTASQHSSTSRLTVEEELLSKVARNVKLSQLPTALASMTPIITGSTSSLSGQPAVDTSEGNILPATSVNVLGLTTSSSMSIQPLSNDLKVRIALSHSSQHSNSMSATNMLLSPSSSISVSGPHFMTPSLAAALMPQFSQPQHLSPSAAPAGAPVENHVIPSTAASNTVLQVNNVPPQVAPLSVATPPRTPARATRGSRRGGAVSIPSSPLTLSRATSDSGKQYSATHTEVDVTPLVATAAPCELSEPSQFPSTPTALTAPTTPLTEGRRTRRSSEAASPPQAPLSTPLKPVSVLFRNLLVVIRSCNMTTQ